MSTITTGNHPKHLWPGVHDFFGQSYSDHREEWRDLFDVKSSTMSYEELVQDTGFGLAPIKTQGASVSYDTDAQGFTKRFTHVVYALGFIVTREERDDNQYTKVATKRAGSLKRSMIQTKENVCANVYNRATTSGYTGGDGVVLLSASHPTLSGNQSNILATPADLSEQAIEDMIIQIMGAKDDRGLTIKLMPQSLHIARQNWFEANRILKSTLQNDTANNAINVLRAENMLPGGVKPNHYFTDADQWFIRTDCPDSMVFFQRDPLEFTKDNDFDTENAKAKARERYSCSHGDWRGVYGSPGA